MKQVWVEIVKTYTVQAVNGPTYKAGTVHLLPEQSAEHLRRKGVARIKNHGDLDEMLARVEAQGKACCDETETREVSTNVDLHSLFNEYRNKEGLNKKAPEVNASPEPVNEKAPETNSDLGEGMPMVSCIMPTWNRRRFIRAALDCWNKQTYENRELIILDDGQEEISDLLPDDKRIRYLKLDEKVTTGKKRNLCCEMAKGPLICHFDDDDYSEPDRIFDQVKRIQASGLHITGYSTILFWDTLTGQVKRYSGGQPGYIVGTSFMYTKTLWQQIRFKDEQQFTDNEFLKQIGLERVAYSHDATKMVARIHDQHHTSPKEGFAETVERELVPQLFWDNEIIRVQG